MPDLKTDEAPKPKTTSDLLAIVVADARACADAAKRDQLDLAAAARFYDALADLFDGELRGRGQADAPQATAPSSPLPAAPLGAAPPAKPLG